MVLNDQIKIATEVLDDMAHMWIESYLEGCNHYDTGMTFTEMRQWIEAGRKGYKIVPGEQYREYEWIEVEYEVDEPFSVNATGNCDIIREIPALAAICKRLKLYP